MGAYWSVPKREGRSAMLFYATLRYAKALRYAMPMLGARRFVLCAHQRRQLVVPVRAARRRVTLSDAYDVSMHRVTYLCIVM